ncbi:MAG: glycosyltransferase family 4 protein [Rhodospirillales bacterium]|nr:glycosyltransferase family 4 protein [Rhodospirillales bacterium]MCB9995393.1 glycosyltransferase family 4 protein [Rhodospirillales bacterium]
MNVLIIASKFPPEYSGPGVRIPRLYKAIGEELGIKRVEVLCNGLEKPYDEDYEHEGWPVKRRVASYIRQRKFPFNLLPSAVNGNLAYFAETVAGLKMLEQYKDIDYIHILGHSGLTAAALSWAKCHDIPVLIELVTAKARPCQKLFFIGKACPPENSVIMTFRSDTEEKCRAAGFDTQIWKRPNPINEEIYKLEPERKAALRAAHTPFKESDIVLCSVAKIIPQKNQRFLLDVLRELPEEYKLVIAGPKVVDGPLYERDKNYLQDIYDSIESYGLTGRVHIVPDYVESADFMKLADLYMLPAYNEGFATPMLEANACGIPVIANEGEYSFGEWIKNGENGFLCPLDAPKWAQACRKAAEFPEKQRHEQAARITAAAGQKNIYKTYVNLINKLVGNTSSPR